jgi:hypothetical protein
MDLLNDSRYISADLVENVRPMRIKSGSSPKCKAGKSTFNIVLVQFV